MKTIAVQVTTAIELSKDQLDKISKAVSNKYSGKKVEVEAVVDPSVIGGIKMIVDSVEFDATVAGKLDKLSSHLQQQL